MEEMQFGPALVAMMLLQGADAAPCELMDFMALENAAQAPAERVERGLVCLAGRLADVDLAVVSRAKAVMASDEAAFDAPAESETDRRLQSIRQLLAKIVASRPSVRTELPLFARLDARVRFGLRDYCGAVAVYDLIREDLFRRALARAPYNLAGLTAMIDHFRDTGRRACNVGNTRAAASAALELYRMDRELSRPKPVDRAG